MEKITKKAIKCKTCHKVIKGAVYEFFCDECGKGKNKNTVHLTVFLNDVEETKNYELCSWKCLIKRMKRENRKPYQFMTMGYLHSIKQTKNREDSTEGFLDLLKE
jgi:hypothetical protein